MKVKLADIVRRFEGNGLRKGPTCIKCGTRVLDVGPMKTSYFCDNPKCRALKWGDPLPPELEGDDD